MLKQINILDFVDDVDRSVFLNRDALSKQAAELHDGYCKVIGKKGLPKSDFFLLEWAAANYSINPLINGAVNLVQKGHKSLRKNVDHRFVENFEYFVFNYLKLLNKSAARKSNYNNYLVDSFYEKYKDNESLGLIKEYLERKEIDLKKYHIPIMEEIFDNFSKDEIIASINVNDKFSDCWNLNYLLGILKGMNDDRRFKEELDEESLKEQEDVTMYIENEKELAPLGWDRDVLKDKKFKAIDKKIINITKEENDEENNRGK